MEGSVALKSDVKTRTGQDGERKKAAGPDYNISFRWSGVEGSIRLLK